MSSIYQFSAQPMSGKPVPLKKFEGKVLLIVNTASACGFTPQFAGLQTLHDTWGPKGLVLLGFPCNQFGAQDPGSNEDIASFCQLNYGAVSYTHLDVYKRQAQSPQLPDQRTAAKAGFTHQQNGRRTRQSRQRRR